MYYITPPGVKIYRVVGVVDLISTYPRVYFVFFKKFFKKKDKIPRQPLQPCEGRGNLLIYNNANENDSYLHFRAFVRLVGYGVFATRCSRSVFFSKKILQGKIQKLMVLHGATGPDPDRTQIGCIAIKKAPYALFWCIKLVITGAGR